MKKRIGAAFNTMYMNLGVIAFAWFVLWAIFPDTFTNQSRSYILWFGCVYIGLSLFKGYCDQVKKDKAEEMQ